MKRILLLPLFVLLAFVGFGQISYDPDVVEGSGDVNLVNDIEADFHINNESDETKNLLWRIKVLSAPDNWKFYLCDANLCYGPGQDLCDPTKPNVTEPDSSAVIAFHVLVSGTQGVGTYEIEYFDTAAQNDILVTVPITINAFSTSLEEESQIEAINIFPNPASSYFSITENNLISEIAIYNVIGKQIKSYKSEQNGSYSVADLSDGMYLVRLIDNQGKVAKVLRINKR